MVHAAGRRRRALRLRHAGSGPADRPTRRCDRDRPCSWLECRSGPEEAIEAGGDPVEVRSRLVDHAAEERDRHHAALDGPAVGLGRAARWASPHTISTEKAPSRPSIGCSRPLATVRGGSIATSVWRHPAISSNPTLGTLTLTTTGSAGRSASTAATTSAPTRAAVVPALVGDHLVPALALDAVLGDRLAHGDAAGAAVAGGQRGADRARVVDRPPDVGARVDAGDDEVDRTEHAEAGEHHAQPGRPVHRPRLGDALDVGAADLRLQQVQGARAPPSAPEYSLSGATTTTSPSGTRARARTWRPDGVDPVVVGDQQARHRRRQLRVVPIGSDRRT